MYGYVRPHRLALLAGGLLSLATSATGLLLPLVVRALIDDLSRHRGLSSLIVVMCLLMAADVVLGAAGGYVLLRAADTIVLNTRQSLAGRLLRVTVGSFDASEPGDLMARATVDTTLLRGVVSSAIVPAVTGTLSIFAGLALMGLETFVGHRGMRLSGGERQRVAIARALLRHPRLLLLDEATSQLDAINEAALRETVAGVAQSITVLVVAHRLSTVTLADRIIVLADGRVQATGTHTELIAASPLYAQLAATQFLVPSAYRD
jgi:ABC-type multidrug transport system fused ATPase/permease subunit